MTDKAPNVKVACEDFLSAGGHNTFPDLTLEGRIEVMLPKDFRGKKLTKEQKKEILVDLLKKKAHKLGCSHVFYFGYSQNHNLAVGDGYKTHYQEIKLSEQLDAYIKEEKYNRIFKPRE